MSMTPENFAEIREIVKKCTDAIQDLSARIQVLEEELRQRDAALQTVLDFLNHNSRRMAAGNAAVVNVLVAAGLVTEEEMEAEFSAALSAVEDEVCTSKQTQPANTACVLPQAADNATAVA